MLQNLNLERILFLDIETVSQAKSFTDLDEDFQNLWEEKSRYQRERDGHSLEESYSRAGIFAEFGKIICISCGYLGQRMGDRSFEVKSFYGHEEGELLREFSDWLYNQEDEGRNLLCAHNGKEFDFPYIARRMLVNGIPLPPALDIAGKKPWEVAHLDTMLLWRFGDYKSFTSLKLLAKVFNIPTPKDDIDGSQVGRVYWEEGDLERIEQYCRKDVLTVAQLLLKYRGEEILEDHETLQA